MSEEGTLAAVCTDDEIDRQGLILHLLVIPGISS